MSKDLDGYLTAQMGRRVSREEIAVAAGISIATYTRRKSDGFPAGEVIAAARSLGLSAAKVLLDLDYLTAAEILEAAGDNGKTVDGASEVELAEALYRRLCEQNGVNADDLIGANQARALDVTGLTQDDLDLASFHTVEIDDDEDDHGNYA